MRQKTTGFSPAPGAQRCTPCRPQQASPQRCKAQSPDKGIFAERAHNTLQATEPPNRWKLSVCVLCGSPVWPSPPVVGPLWGPPLCVGPLFGSPVWVPCVGPLCGSPVWVPCVGPLCVGPLCVGLLCGSPVWVPRPDALRHVASTRVMSPARSHAPA